MPTDEPKIEVPVAQWPPQRFPVTFAFAAAGLPFLVVLMESQLFRLPQVSVGEWTGLLLGLLVGVRSRRLIGWVCGPPVGFIAGFLDVRIQYVIGCREWITPNGAALIPVWGALLGFVLAVANRRTRPALFALFAGPCADFLGRIAAEWAVVHGLVEPERMGADRWIVEAICFAPGCAILALAIPSVWRGDAAPDDPPPARIRHWLIPAAIVAVALIALDVLAECTKTPAPLSPLGGHARIDDWVDRDPLDGLECLGIPTGRAVLLLPNGCLEYVERRLKDAGWQRWANPEFRSEISWNAGDLGGAHEQAIGFLHSSRYEMQELATGSPPVGPIDRDKVYVMDAPRRTCGALILALDTELERTISLECLGVGGRVSRLEAIPDRARYLAASAAMVHRSDRALMHWLDVQVDGLLAWVRSQRVH